LLFKLYNKLRLQSELVVYKQLGKPDDAEGENTTLAFDFLKSNDKLSREEALEARSQVYFHLKNN